MQQVHHGSWVSIASDQVHQRRQEGSRGPVSVKTSNLTSGRGTGVLEALECFKLESPHAWIPCDILIQLPWDECYFSVAV